MKRGADSHPGLVRKYRQGLRGLEMNRRLACFVVLPLLTTSLPAETWMGLEVRPENRCSAYNRDRDYRYSQSVEPAIAKRMGGIRAGTRASDTRA